MTPIWSVLIVVATVLWLLFARDNKAAAGARGQVAFSTEFKNVMQTGLSWLMCVFAIFISGVTVFVISFLPRR
ncbi:MAG: hypothetical protein WAN11_04990 [Syntrophobacteraceae bacterium]